jgi:mono/diheme cytochrome c family protein
VNWSIPGGSPVETGIFRGKYYDTFPFPITRADLERGQQRFNVYCSPCHGVLGNGDGMIARRGFNLRRKPANFHDERLVKIAIGHFFDVMTNGYGIMYSYAERVDVMDRWRIAAYIRALQLSESQTLQDVPESERQKLTAGGM